MSIRPGIALVLAAGLGSGCLIDSSPSAPVRSFSVTWKLADRAEPDPERAPPLACADVGIGTILLDLLEQDGGSSSDRFLVEFTCPTMVGTTPAVPQSRYRVFAMARGNDGVSRSQITFDADNYSDARSDLGLIIFTVDR